MHILAHSLVQRLLRSDGVVHHAPGLSSAEVGEVRHDGEVVVGAVALMQRGAVRTHDPLDPAAHALGFDRTLIERVGNRLFGQVRHDGDVAALREYQAVRLFVDRDLPVDDAIALEAVAAHDESVEQARIAVAAKLVAAHLVVGFAVVLAIVPRRLGLVAGIAAPKLLDLVRRQPARDGHVAPLVGVIALGVRVRDHVTRVQIEDGNVAFHVPVEVHSDIEVAALLNQAITVDLRFHPMQLRSIGDLHGHLRQDGRGFHVALLPARLERNVHAVLDLVADGAVHAGLDLVELVERPSLAAQDLLVGVAPLLAAAHVHALAQLGPLGVLDVAAVLAVLVAGPVLAGALIVCHGQASRLVIEPSAISNRPCSA